jgi:oxygen-independent coproporphyrinogen-3 oxidase
MPGASPTPELEQPAVGSYFVANYPPFSVWTAEAAATEARAALARPAADAPLGLYLHIPFCRKRCHFCYFRVYVDKSAREVELYLDVLAREWDLYRETAAVAGRPLNFVYFGGGTPSFLSTRQLQGLVSRLGGSTPWSDAEEITFECEPGTLSEAKLEAIRRMGVSRLSLGVENFDDRILEINGRAPFARDREVVPFRARARLPADQHRPDRRHARRDGRELARVRPAHARPRAGQRDHLPDGAAVQHVY